jgi:hypothetical protein
VEATRLDTAFDRSPTEAEVEQLLARQDVMLPPSKAPSCPRSLLLLALI